MNFSDITFCIKTINRPWACHRLVESLFRSLNDPKIVVADDGQEDLRFSKRYSGSANKCEVIEIEEFDVGVGAGRNAAVAAAKTDYIFLLDDDHVVGAGLRIGELIKRMALTQVEMLGVRQGDGGMPYVFETESDGKGLRVVRGVLRRGGGVKFCDLCSNAFLSPKRTVQSVGWDEEIKTCEHWEFFYRAKKLGVSVGVATDCRVRHDHVAMTAYKRLRSREFYRSVGLRKHGLTTLRWGDGPVYRV